MVCLEILIEFGFALGCWWLCVQMLGHMWTEVNTYLILNKSPKVTKEELKWKESIGIGLNSFEVAKHQKDCKWAIILNSLYYKNYF